jgi:hypothetical protein
MRFLWGFRISKNGANTEEKEPDYIDNWREASAERVFEKAMPGVEHMSLDRETSDSWIPNSQYRHHRGHTRRTKKGDKKAS